jgi:hypothetical protein
MTVYNNIVSDITIQCENREYQLHMQVLRCQVRLSSRFLPPPRLALERSVAFLTFSEDLANSLSLHWYAFVKKCADDVVPIFLCRLIEAGCVDTDEDIRAHMLFVYVR